MHNIQMLVTIIRAKCDEAILDKLSCQRDRALGNQTGDNTITDLLPWLGLKTLPYFAKPK